MKYLLVCFLLLTASCGDGDKSKGGAPATPFAQPKQDPPDLGPKNFQTLSAEVLKPYCVKCHNAEKAEKEINLSSWSAVEKKPALIKKGDPEHSQIYDVILIGTMPPKEILSEELTEKVRVWIKEM